MRVFAFLGAHKWKLLLLLIIGFLFYWYEVRPIMVYRRCAAESSLDARKLLKSKSDIAKGTANGEMYKRLLEKNMYLRSDYESFMKKCLNYNGLDMAIGQEEGASSSSSSK